MSITDDLDPEALRDLIRECEERLSFLGCGDAPIPAGPADASDPLRVELAKVTLQLAALVKFTLWNGGHYRDPKMADEEWHRMIAVLREAAKGCP